jgi:hypothetical protein
MQCRSWRLLDNHHEPLHMPGECDACWSGCKNKLKKQPMQGSRCDECWRKMADASTYFPIIGASLMAEGQIPTWVVRHVAEHANDLNTKLTAEERLHKQSALD